MATRTGRISKPDDRGQFARQLGWKLNATGKRVQHKFRLGSDRTTAELREAILRRIWGVIEKEPEPDEPLWDDTTLAIAVQVAGGADRVRLPVLDQNETASRRRPIDFVKHFHRSVRSPRGAVLKMQIDADQGRDFR